MSATRQLSRSSSRLLAKRLGWPDWTASAIGAMKPACRTLASNGTPGDRDPEPAKRGSATASALSHFAGLQRIRLLVAHTLP
jgi:hypothetical protein